MRKENAEKFNLKYEEKVLEDLETDGRIILHYMSKWFKGVK
jgi:hypothetical protein